MEVGHTGLGRCVHSPSPAILFGGAEGCAFLKQNKHRAEAGHRVSHS